MKVFWCLTDIYTTSFYQTFLILGTSERNYRQTSSIVFGLQWDIYVIEGIS